MCVCIWGGGHQGSGVGIPPLQEAGGSGGWGASLIETHRLFYWPWGTLHKETSPSLLAPTSWAGPSLAMLGGHTKESRGRGWGRTDTASWPSPSSTQIGVGVLSPSCNHFYLILLCVVHGRIYLLSEDALQLWSVYLRRDCILKESITQY